ncbi:MAG: hypothetical protein ACI3U8_04730 [Candidatus Onthomonas sp.]
MREKDDWTLFLETGLPQAYTYLKAKERKKAPEAEEKRSRKENQSR